MDCDGSHADLDDFVRLYVAHAILRASTSVGQRPLLASDLQPGLVVAVPRRSQRCLEWLHGPEGAPLRGRAPQLIGEVGVAGACVLVVTETSLVHYTKKARKPLSGCANAEPAESTAGTAPEQAYRRQDVDEKYWKRRYNFFSRFDEGVRMDPAAWFEVTPESIARHIADRMPYDRVVDGTCGVGGNAIQFAMTSRHVIAVDTDAQRLRDAEHNAKIYGVRERIDFVCDDFAKFAASYVGPAIDAVFLSPPWGGPSHLDSEHFSLKDVGCPDIVHLFAAAAAVAKRVVLYLPRHQDLHEIALLARRHGFAAVEVEKVFFQHPTRHLKLVMVHFTPEAVMANRSALTTQKSVGPPQRRRDPEQLAWGSGTNLLDPVPLAGLSLMHI